MSRAAAILIVIVIGILALAFTISAQNFQVRTNVDLVVVPATVRDGKGKLVTGLTQKDFKVFEDGVPQSIVNFSDDPQPLSAAIVIDTSMGGIALRRIPPILIALTNGFSEFDEMASFRYDHLVFQLSDFTTDQEKIWKSLDIVKTIAQKQPDRVAPGDPIPAAPAILRSILGMINFGGHGGAVESTMRRPTETLPTVGSRRVDPSRLMFDALYDASKALEARPAHRRRIILIVSDGQVSSGSNTHDLGEITDLLLRNNIQIYSVNTDSDPIGRRFGVLGSLARATGGDEYRGQNILAMENAFSRISEQARNQYVLGYQSTNRPIELPVVRKIEVTGRDSNWKIIHRKGYTQLP